MPEPEVIKELKDSIARTSARLEQVQMTLDDFGHLLPEDERWKFQAEIDERRFHLEMDRNQVNAQVHKK